MKICLAGLPAVLFVLLWGIAMLGQARNYKKWGGINIDYVLISLLVCVVLAIGISFTIAAIAKILSGGGLNMNAICSP